MLLELLGLWAIASAVYLCDGGMASPVDCGGGVTVVGLDGDSRGPRCWVEETGSVAFGAGVV